MIGQYGIHDVAALAVVALAMYGAIKVSLWVHDRAERRRRP